MINDFLTAEELPETINPKNVFMGFVVSKKEGIWQVGYCSDMWFEDKHLPNAVARALIELEKGK